MCVLVLICNFLCGNKKVNIIISVSNSVFTNQARRIANIYKIERYKFNYLQAFQFNTALLFNS